MRRADLPAPPPKAYRGLPLPAGWHIRRLPTLGMVAEQCRELLGLPSGPEGDSDACTVRSRREIISPEIGRAVDAERQAKLDEHEIAHAWDLSHENAKKGGRDWYDQFGKPVGNRLTPEQAANLKYKLEANAEAEKRLALMRQMYPQRPNLFAEASPARAENLFRGR